MTILVTERLRMRPYEDADIAAFRAMNLDPEVMHHLGGKSQSEADFLAMIDRIKTGWAERGYGWWTVLPCDGSGILGAVGLQHIDRDSDKPHEIIWRLLRAHWGRGYATEAARAARQYCFEMLNAPELVAVTRPSNAASINVMRKLGMDYVTTEIHYGWESVVYRIDRNGYFAARADAAA
jgi:RimJ/RimL family protein N-acetyltransferase